jgi:hypothetical protein
MKIFTLSTTILLSTLSFLTPLTEAAPVDPVETGLRRPTPVSAAIAKQYLASCMFLLWIGITDGSSSLDH